MIDTLDGFLAAVVIGPGNLQPSYWLPGVLGAEAEEPEPWRSLRIIGTEAVFR